MREVAIAGIGLVKFGRYDGQKGRPYREIYELGAEAITKALKYADMEWKDIQAAYGASMFGGLGVPNQCTSRLGMPGIPITTVEGACTSSQQGMRQAYLDVANGLYDVGLAFGAEKIPLVPSAYAAGRLNPILNIHTGASVSAIKPGGIFSTPKARPTSYKPLDMSK